MGNVGVCGVIKWWVSGDNMCFWQVFIVVIQGVVQMDCVIVVEVVFDIVQQVVYQCQMMGVGYQFEVDKCVVDLEILCVVIKVVQIVSL